MILVTGATGTTGRYVVEGLLSIGTPVRALTRDPLGARVKPWLTNAEVVPGNFLKPESLDASLVGVNAVYVVPSPGPTWDVETRNMVAAARRAGTKRVVWLSVIDFQPDPQAPAVIAHREAERLLESSGLAWTLVRPTSFLQNIPNVFMPWSGSDGTFFRQCTGDGEIALIDARDVADVVVLALTEDGHEGRRYDLSGGEAITFADAATRIAATIGRSFRYIDVEPEEYQQELEALGFPPALAAAVVAVYGDFFRSGAGNRVTDDYRATTGRAPRTIEEFAVHAFAQ
jgi:uncharacterized protein YbjT (DUF2867 family)